MAHALTVVAGDTHFDCRTVILVPVIALSEPGYIRTISTGTGAQEKHACYCLAQTAHMQFQDRELDLVTVDGAIAVCWKDETVEVVSGMVIAKTLSGQIVTVTQSKDFCRKLLETAYRFCSRWVRLDI